MVWEAVGDTQSEACLGDHRQEGQAVEQLLAAISQPTEPTNPDFSANLHPALSLLVCSPFAHPIWGT